MPQPPFALVDPAAAHAPAQRRVWLAERQRAIPATLGSHEAAAPLFRPSGDLVAAINVALAVGAPLLLTGEPGTGKTQVGYYIKWYFGIDLHQLDVRSTTTAADLLYRFDSVAYFHAAHDPARAAGPVDKKAFLAQGPLWRAIEAKSPSVVLIDEVDKAPRDFPNDVLGALDQSRFFVPEADVWIDRAADAPRPILVITSNSERRLPEPFLRRCIFHHLALTPDLLKSAVDARRAQFARLGGDVVDAAVERFWELREKPLRKKPATAELLVWLTLLGAEGTATAERIRDVPLSELPHLGALVKDRDDLAAL